VFLPSIFSTLWFYHCDFKLKLSFAPGFNTGNLSQIFNFFKKKIGPSRWKDGSTFLHNYPFSRDLPRTPEQKAWYVNPNPIASGNDVSKPGRGGQRAGGGTRRAGAAWASRRGCGMRRQGCGVTWGRQDAATSTQAGRGEQRARWDFIISLSVCTMYTNVFFIRVSLRFDSIHESFCASKQWNLLL
jgi:hypothetical protein